MRHRHRRDFSRKRRIKDREDEAVEMGDGVGDEDGPFWGKTEEG